MGMAVMWFTGMSKKPWMASWCRSTVMMLSMPETSSRSATSLAVMGSRGAALRILTGVTVVRDDRRDGAAACALGGIGHDEQLHEGVVHVEGLARAHRLDEEHVGAADGLLVAGVDLAVGELLVLDVAEVHVQVLGDLLGQLRIHRAGEQDHALGHLGHRVRPFCDGSFSFGYW